jgi:tetratricopeptide (TPR) repeat protein
MSLPQVGFRRNCFLARLTLGLVFYLGSAGLALGADGQQATQPSDSVKQQVRSLIREAGQLVERGDNRGAAARLEQARVLWSEPSIDYNLGIVYGDLGQPHEAAQALERFLRSADRSMVLTERLEDAKRRLREYERTLSRLAVTVTLPADATQPSLFLDGALRSKLPSGNTPPPGYLFTAPGLHEVRVASSGLRDFAVSVELFPGELRKLAGALAPSASGDAALLPYTTPPPSDESKPFYKRWWFWTAVGGGAVVIAGVVGAAAAGSFNRVAPGTDLDPIDVSR